ncbi:MULTISPECIES: response regulator transcription factor [Alkalibacillus]|uniref:DNA-binding response regulator n=2 Tax=Alkalibacillus TaxID=331654 RepID=A0A511W2E2_9BACI|nr:response regulator transcription factor [Alkalibacillus haloalkaliphilus]GEN44548.1 DNA-binding response regulator [Alkalibacillus haloalkaliphilus]
MNQTILVVEDDQMIRHLIRVYLEKANYEVIEASDGLEAQEKFVKYQPCLIILDLMLPKLSGEDFCQWVRDYEQEEVSIIILSAKTQVQDKVHLLRIGADDYLTKPFEPEELIAHVEAVLRRTGRYCQKITYDGLCLKVRKGEVLLNGEEINLTKHEFHLLYFFMQNPNTVLTRDQLIEQLYPASENVVYDRTIDAHIKKLREKLHDKDEPKKIQTVRGMGYKFVPKESIF